MLHVRSFPQLWQTSQQLTQQPCYLFSTRLRKVHLRQTLLLNTEKIPILFSLPLFTTPFSPLLFILSQWDQDFKDWWILHRYLKADSLGGVPSPPRPLVSQLLFSNNFWLNCIYLSPHNITIFFFFLKKRLVSVQILADSCGTMPQRNLFHSSALPKHETSQTCLWQLFAESLFRHNSFSR